MKSNEEVKAEFEEKFGKWRPHHFLMLLIGLPPGIGETWKKSNADKLSIIILSLIISSFTIALPTLIILGISRSNICVPGNKDYEANSGLCANSGKKEAEAKELAERKAKESAELEEKEKDTEATYRAMRYICEQSIKSRLREPSSYERIGSKFFGSPNGDNKKGVIIEYRARNGFGGMNVVSAACLTETGSVEDLKMTVYSER